MTFLLNLWHIAKQVPQIIGVIKTIIDIVGLEQVQSLLMAIRDAVKKTAAEQGETPKTEEERVRLFKKLLQRRTFGNLGMSEGDYAAFCYPEQEKNYA